ncbi:hypothetical protein V8G54_004176 [Vigna mungo]|uniref:Uncharacterized protein n=1 Tax=Vigna mungo TaxID=3915 RepID=A0AAQ3PDC7_VIGMU
MLQTRLQTIIHNHPRKPLINLPKHPSITQSSQDRQKAILIRHKSTTFHRLKQFKSRFIIPLLRISSHHCIPRHNMHMRQTILKNPPRIVNNTCFTIPINESTTYHHTGIKPRNNYVCMHYFTLLQRS